MSTHSTETESTSSITRTNRNHMDSLSFFKAFWKYILPIPIFVCLIAFNQLRLSQFSTLTTWKGGGFGMFATISYRFYHLHLLDSKTFNCVEKPSELRFKQRLMSNYPTYSNMSSIAEYFARQQWMFQYKFVYGKRQLSVKMVNDYNKQNWKPESNVLFDKFEVLVYDVEFNHHTLTLSPVLIKNLTINKPLL